MAEDKLDSKKILTRIQERKGSLDFPFQDIGREFRIIHTTLEPVIIPSCPAGSGSPSWRIPESLLQSLENNGYAGSLARQLQPYAVQIPPRARAGLLAVGAVRAVREAEFGAQFVVLDNDGLYGPDTGLNWENPFFRTAESLMY